MQFSGLPTLLGSLQLSNLLTETRKTLDDKRIEAVTGRAADVSKHLDGNIGRAQSLEKLIADNDHRRDAIELLATDYDITQNTLDVARTESSSIAARVMTAQGLENEASMRALRLDAEAELENLFGRMNTPFGGRQLLSGAATGARPLGDLDTMLTAVQAIVVAGPDRATVEAALDTYFDDPGGGFQTTIYQGSAASGPDREVAAGRRMSPEVKADDQMFRDLFRGLALLATSNSGGVADALTKELETDAASRLNSASSQLLDRQTLLGAEQNELETLTARNEAETFAYQSALHTLIGINQEEAATEMTLLETQLEASYLATSRFANLSLVNYMR